MVDNHKNMRITDALYDSFLFILIDIITNLGLPTCLRMEF